MHPALQIPEILLNVFRHFRLPTTQTPTSDLSALARTCRAFKEPALDVLWAELVDPSPLARCLPEASHLSSQADKCYSFTRSLTRTEWDTLRGYTCRILSMRVYNNSLDWKSVETFLNPPVDEPLFPSLLHLYGRGSTATEYLLYMPFPSPISLGIEMVFEENSPSILRRSLEAFSKSSPNIRELTIDVGYAGATFSSSCICRWQDLRVVICPNIALDMDALTHLSHMPELTRLSCTLGAIPPTSDSVLHFSNLHDLTLYSEALHPISRLLSWARLPVITDLTIFINSCPSKLDLSSVFASVQTSFTGHTIQELRFIQGSNADTTGVTVEDRTVLDLEDLQPLLAFSNLRRMTLDIKWQVKLMDKELLALVLAWPHLEHLLINEAWGWSTQGGVTPDGLVRLLQTCRSLSWIALAIDTRGYTEFPQSLTSHELALPPTFVFNVVDSVIEPESVPTIAAFFASIAHRPNFPFRAWRGRFMQEAVYADHWGDVYRRVKEAIGQNC